MFTRHKSYDSSDDPMCTHRTAAYNILTFNTYIALIRMRSKRFKSIVLQYDLEI